MKTLIAASISLLLLKPATAQKIKPNDPANAIQRSNELYGLAFVRGDSALFIDRYSTDAWIMPPNAPSLKGSTAASTFYRIAYYDMGIRNVILSTQEIVVNRNNATETGTFELKNARNETIKKGKYLVLWKKTDRGWKMYRDCFNADD